MLRKQSGKEKIMANYENGYYRFSYNGSFLHASNSSKVTVSTTRTGGQNQFWRLNDNKLKSEAYSTSGIGGTSSVTLSSSPANISVVVDTANKGYIKNTSSGKYLGISSGSLVWSTSKTSWKVERVYKKTGVPKYDPEYFSEKSGMTDGEWSTYWTNYLKSFFAKLYGGQASAVTDNNIGQCMYGAIYSSSLYKGKFHTGLDFLKGGTSVVKCPFTGEYLGCDTKYGCVYVYDSGTNCTFVFMHMNIANNTANNIAILSKTAGETITQGTPMGFESNKADGNPMNQHLHIEVHKGKVTKYASIPENSYDSIESVSPYGAIYQVL